MPDPFPESAPASTAEWEPGYVTWATSIYSGAAAGLAAASWLSPQLAARTEGWGFPALFDILSSEGSSGSALYLFVAMILVLIAVLPGLLSLFLITLARARLALHPVVGAIFFGASAGLIVQSFGAAVFGFVFGFTSLGTSALLLGLRRRLDLSRSRD